MARRDVRNVSTKDSQANFDDLRECPFCGGEAETLTAESMHGGYLFGVMCSDCRSRGDVYTTEAEAIAAWNSRADYHGYEQAAIEAWESIKAWNSRAERTCAMIPSFTKPATLDDCQEFCCSACGEYMVLQQFQGCADDVPNYCPNCGCKVVDE